MSGDDTNTDYAGEAEDTRERIAATIDELQDRLNPRRIVGDAVGSVQAQGADLLNEGLRLVKAHPAIVAGAGLAIGIALLGNSKLRRAKVDLGDNYETYSDYDDDYSSNTGPVEGGGERFALLRDRAGTSIEDNPLVAIIVGVAAGALLGALFPETASERRLMGEASGRVAAAARAAARTARDELATMGEKVADATGHAKAAVQSVVDAAKTEFHDRAPG